jgi:hypothetical protein
MDTKDLTDIERAGRRCGVCHSGRGWRRFEIVRPAERDPVVLCGSAEPASATIRRSDASPRPRRNLECPEVVDT